MKETLNNLDAKERYTLSLLALCLLLAAVFLIFVSWRQRGTYLRAVSELKSKQKSYEEAELARKKSREDWLRWEEAQRDLADLRTNYFYDVKDSLKSLMLDLNQILAEAGVSYSQIHYDYHDLDKERIRVVSISFNFSGSYLSLKKFLEIVEKFSKFLVIERIDFGNISGGGNNLELKIVLAAYHEI